MIEDKIDKYLEEAGDPFKKGGAMYSPKMSKAELNYVRELGSLAESGMLLEKLLNQNMKREMESSDWKKSMTLLNQVHTALQEMRSIAKNAFHSKHGL